MKALSGYAAASCGKLFPCTFFRGIMESGDCCLTAGLDLWGQPQTTRRILRPDDPAAGGKTVWRFSWRMAESVGDKELRKDREAEGPKEPSSIDRTGGQCDIPFSVLFEAATDAIFCIDREGRFRAVNPAAARALGLEPGQLVGKHMREVFPPEFAQRQLHNVQRVFETGEPVADLESATAVKGGVRWYSTSLSPVRGPNGQVELVMGVARDVTPLRRQREEWERLAEELRHAQKMEAVGRLASTVAHDFNNILTAIIGYAQLLEAALPEGSPERRNAEEIRRAAQRASGLTRQLLAFVRKRPARLTVCSLNKIIKENTGLLKQLVGDRIELELDLALDLKPLRADPDQLLQVLINLASNARDAMPEGGRLRIATANKELRQARAALPGLAPGSYVVLTVSDTGCGMNRETVARIFEPFFTTKKEGSGTGLGLSIVYSIVRQHGGRVLVHSKAGKGTSFQIYLPATDGCTAPEDR